MKGKTNSPYSLGVRKRKAYEYYSKGYKPAEVAQELEVSLGTAVRYKDDYETHVAEMARSNPTMLRNILANTFRMLDELDQVRMSAWQRHERASSDAMRATMLGLVLKAQDQRAKLFGLFGVKQDFFLHVSQVRDQQEKIIEFMKEKLCPTCRIEMEEFLVEMMNEELAQMPTADTTT